ncbi:Molecular chaperone (DnaJ super) [Recurvomyces mirabilis]|nr:Molecular chaperone (DnaJ super) [Recurvomyces mirabilis]
MPKDTKLYDILGVRPDADATQIRHAYMQRSKQTHPDRPKGDSALFARLATAYNILIDPKEKAAYDRDGYKHTPLSDQDAKASFSDAYKDEYVLDDEAANLIDHWVQEETLDEVPKISLGTDFEGVPENLAKLFGDYSLMSSSPRGRQAINNLASYCGKHFGARNEQILKDWDGKDQLTPFIGNQYYTRDGGLVDKPEVLKLTWPINDLMKLHREFEDDFRQLLEGSAGALEVLRVAHRPRYNAMLTQNLPVMEGVAKKIVWATIDETLRELRNLASKEKGVDTVWKTKRVKYDTLARQHRFPPDWTQMVDEKLAPDLKRTIATQSTWKPTTAAAQSKGKPATVESEVRDEVGHDLGVAGPVTYPDLGPISAPSTRGSGTTHAITATGDDNTQAAGSPLRSPKGKEAIRPDTNVLHDDVTRSIMPPNNRDASVHQVHAESSSSQIGAPVSRDLGTLEDASAEIFVRDWKQNSFKVFGWRTFGRAEQIFLETESGQQLDSSSGRRSALKILRIESASPYRATLETVKQQPMLDLNRKQLMHDDLRRHDLSDLNIVAFAQKTPGVAPASGYPRDTPCYFISKSESGYGIATKSDMMRAYGDHAVGRMVDEIWKSGSKDLIKLKPMQKRLAMEYAAMNDSDSDSDSDSSETPLMSRDGRREVRRLGSGYRARPAQPYLMLGARQGKAHAEQSQDRVESAVAGLEDLSLAERKIVFSNYPAMTGEPQTAIEALNKLREAATDGKGEDLAVIDQLLKAALELRAKENQRVYV